MICLRCGYCCLKSRVVIVDNLEIGPIEGNLKVLDGSEKCPHLRGEKPGEHSCAVHDQSWYKETPCFAHGQVEGSKDDPCRMGRYILNGGYDGNRTY